MPAAPPPGGGRRNLGGSPPDPVLASLAYALAALGDRWSLLVVAGLFDGPLRFGDLQARVGGIAPNVLSQRLRALEAAGVVVATPYSDRPPRFLYELSAAGRDLDGAVRMLADWGARHGEDADADAGARAPRHGVCGTPLEARWWCPACQEPVDTTAAGGGPDTLHV